VIFKVRRGVNLVLKRLPMPLDKRSELSPEALGGKAHGVVSAGLGGDAVLLGLKLLDGGHHR